MALQTDWKDMDDWEDWKGWDTLHSGRKSICSTGNAPGKNCWERVLQEDDVCSFSVCRDCLVYLYQQKTATLSKDEIHDILRARRGIPQEPPPYPPSRKKSMRIVSNRL